MITVSKRKYVTNISDVPVFVDVAYMANLMQVSQELVRRMIRDGKIKAAKMGNTWRIPKTEIVKMYEGG